jgi:transcriptional regulator with XRE-family HTH domain
MLLDIQKIAALREKKELSQDAAATAAGFTGRQKWNDIEAGRRTNITLETLERIANALGVKPRELLKK